MLGHNMKAHMRVAVELHAFLISTLDGDEWLASCHGRYTPVESDPLIYCIARWMGLLCQPGYFFFLRKEIFVVLNGNLNVITLLSSTQEGHCTDFTIPASINRP